MLLRKCGLIYGVEMVQSKIQIRKQRNIKTLFCVIEKERKMHYKGGIILWNGLID